MSPAMAWARKGHQPSFTPIAVLATVVPLFIFLGSLYVVDIRVWGLGPPHAAAIGSWILIIAMAGAAGIAKTQVRVASLLALFIGAFLLLQVVLFFFPWASYEPDSVSGPLSESYIYLADWKVDDKSIVEVYLTTGHGEVVLRTDTPGGAFVQSFFGVLPKIPCKSGDEFLKVYTRSDHSFQLPSVPVHCGGPPIRVHL
jgi:hypothetical protein